jgi:hypothetical protein
MPTEKAFSSAIDHARAALVWAEELPHTPRRAWAKDNLQAGLGWLQQAHDEWLTERANHD